MELSILKNIVNNKHVDENLINALNETFDKFKINTKLRQCHFLAQILHESCAFRFTEEIASGKDYEFRKDLGNIDAGDGIKYKGRGYIQITGKINYKMISEYLKEDFLNNPKLLNKNPYAMLSAGIYWQTKNLNNFADKNDILNITKIINGGYNGLDDRKRWLEICNNIL